MADWFPRLASSPFHRFINRSLLGVALLGLWPLIRHLGIQSWPDIGLVPSEPCSKRFGTGFGVGFISLAILALTALVAGARVPVQDPHHLGQKLLGAALTAITVGTIEEILFRGVIFGALCRNVNWVVALVVSSMIYALVHFLESPRRIEAVAWYSGVGLLPLMLKGFIHWQQCVPGFFNLTLAGALLALAFYRTGSLYFSIGLHTGWIFWLKSYSVLTRQAPGASAWVWGGNKMIDGWLALLILALTLPVLQHFSSLTSRADARIGSTKVPA